MKKHLKFKDSSASNQPEGQAPDTAELIMKMQQQLTFLEKKIDMLIAASSSRPGEARSFAKPFQRPDRSYNRDDGRQNNNFRDRMLHKAVCADCNKECEVPFRPSGDRPVYCKDCFSKRKGGNSFKGNDDNRPREDSFVQERHSHKHHSGDDQRPDEKKRRVFKKRKKRD